MAFDKYRDCSSSRHNYSYRFLTHGIGFYIERNYVKQWSEAESACDHSKRWKRKEGWIQCRDCFKILKVSPNLKKKLRHPVINTTPDKPFKFERMPTESTINRYQVKSYELNQNIIHEEIFIPQPGHKPVFDEDFEKKIKKVCELIETHPLGLISQYEIDRLTNPKSFDIPKP